MGLGGEWFWCLPLTLSHWADKLLLILLALLIAALDLNCLGFVLALSLQQKPNVLQAVTVAMWPLLVLIYLSLILLLLF